MASHERTVEHRAKLRAALLGRKDPPEVRAKKKLAAQQRPRAPLSEATKEKIRATLKARGIAPPKRPKKTTPRIRKRKAVAIVAPAPAPLPVAPVVRPIREIFYRSPLTIDDWNRM